jgi:hypothetical protein
MANLVYKALGTVLGGVADLTADVAKLGYKGIVKPAFKLGMAVTPSLVGFGVKTVGHATAGATKVIANAGFDIGKTAINVFEKRPGTYMEQLSKGQFIPIRLKPIVTTGIIGGATAIGATEGYGKANTPFTDEQLRDPNIPKTKIPGTMQQYNSPVIDNMGADGSLVFGLHNMR